MKTIFSRTLILSTFVLLSPVNSYAERSCELIVEEVSSVFDASVGCLRRNCPELSILDYGTPQTEQCARGCNIALQGPPPTGPASELKRCEHFIPKDEKVQPDYFNLGLCLAASESDLSRCESRFSTSDERDYFKLARCLRASEAVALLVEPLHSCTSSGECLKGSRDWQHGPCFEQCNQEAEQLIEVATTTVERCDGIKQSKVSLCSMLRQTINVCFLPKHCDRLNEILKKSCS